MIKWIICILLFPFIYSPIFSLEEYKLSVFVIKLIKQSLNDSYCVNFISDLSNISNLVENGLANSNLPSVIIPYPDVLNYNKTLDCDGYVIVSQNITYIEDLFASKQVPTKFYFQVHKRILIFYNGFANFQTHTFLHATHMKGYRLISIEGLQPITQGNIMKNMKNPKQMPTNLETNKWNIKITNIRRNKSLIVSNYHHDFNILSIDNYKWEPDFQYANKGYKFKISIFDWPPFVIFNGTHVHDGLEYLMLKEIGKGWPIQYVPQTDKDGLWTANIMDVVKAKSEIAMCGQWQLGRSPGNIETTIPYTMMCATFLVPKPYLITQISFVFQPLHPYLWLLCILITFFIGCTWYFIAYIYCKIEKNQEGKPYFDLISCIINSFRIFALVSLDPFPTYAQAIFRYVIVPWFATAMMISCGYSSGFTSTLTYPRYTKPINTLKDMVDQNIWWGSMETDTYDVYASAYNQDLLELVKRFKKEMSVTEKLSRLRTKNYAVTVNSLPTKYITDTGTLDGYGKENMRLLPICAGMYHVILGMQKNSPFLDTINSHLFSFIENGHIAHWLSLIRQRYGLEYMNIFYKSYAEALLNQNIVLDLQKFAGIFIFLMIGCFIGLIIFLVELTKCHPDHRSKKQLQNTQQLKRFT